MNTMALLGILAILYGIVVFIIAAKKPAKIWEMAKIQAFIKVLGDKGTVIFFYVWGTAFLGLGIWLMMK